MALHDTIQDRVHGRCDQWRVRLWWVIKGSVGVGAIAVLVSFVLHGWAWLESTYASDPAAS